MQSNGHGITFSRTCFREYGGSTVQCNYVPECIAIIGARFRPINLTLPDLACLDQVDRVFLRLAR